VSYSFLLTLIATDSCQAPILLAGKMDGDTRSATVMFQNPKDDRDWVSMFVPTACETIDD
jgi:hypothetical protein